MTDIVEKVLLTPVKQRLKFAHDSVAKLEPLNESDLDEVGRLLCHASSTETRKDMPIIRDLKPTDQQEAEAEWFGDNDLPGTRKTDSETDEG